MSRRSKAQPMRERSSRRAPVPLEEMQVEVEDTKIKLKVPERFIQKSLAETHSKDTNNEEDNSESPVPQKKASKSSNTNPKRSLSRPSKPPKSLVSDLGEEEEDWDDEDLEGESEGGEDRGEEEEMGEESVSGTYYGDEDEEGYGLGKRGQPIVFASRSKRLAERRGENDAEYLAQWALVKAGL